MPPPMTQLADRLVIDRSHRTSEGYLAVRARAARTGIYDYLASEIGAPDSFKPTDRVRVYRDEAEVFAPDAVRSFIGKPVTNDHPSVPVTPDNWKDHASGVAMGALRDGEYLAFDLVLMDKALIADVDAGKRELSNGYACALDWTPGVSPRGEAYDARQTNIRGNHIAVVDAGRAGPECSIADRWAVCDFNAGALSAALFNAKENTVVPKIIHVDGMPVNLSDENAVDALVSKFQSQLADKDATIKARDERISALEGEKAVADKALEDAKAQTSAEALDKAVAARTALIGVARAIVPNLQTDGRTDAQIRRDVVDAKLAERAKDMDDAAIAGAFAALSNGVSAINSADATHTPSMGLAPVTVDARHAVEAIRQRRY